MIILFHFFIVLVKHFTRDNSLNENEETMNSSTKTTEHKHDIALVDVEGNIHFDPPVYKQRYAAIQEILLDESWRSSMKKIVEFGCAELNLFQYLKRLYDINEIVAVDIDAALLKDSLFRVQPLIADHLNCRPQQLVFRAVAGSIGTPNPILLNTDAVIGIEVIEHLYPDVLEAVCYNIFGFMQPKVVVFTTPNADFNQLFHDFKGFRHDDHKFEWSREQFESWALNITERFPNYSVTFGGIGPGPKGTEGFGCCSQMALFVATNNRQSYWKCSSTNGVNSQSDELTCNCSDFPCYESFGICTYMSYSQAQCNNTYEEVGRIEYPYYTDPRSSEQIIIDELKYLIGTFRHSTRFYNYDTFRSEIPISFLISNEHTRFVTVAEAEQLLVTKAGFKVEECVLDNFAERCVIYEPEMENDHSDSDTCDCDHRFESEDNYYESEADWTSELDARRSIAVDVANEIVDEALDNAEIFENVQQMETKEDILKSTPPFAVPVDLNGKSDSEKSKEFSANFSNSRKRKKGKSALHANKLPATVDVRQKSSDEPLEDLQGTSGVAFAENVLNNLQPRPNANADSGCDLNEECNSENREDLEVASREVLFDEYSQLHLMDDLDDAELESRTAEVNQNEDVSSNFTAFGPNLPVNENETIPRIHPSAIEVDVDEETTTNSNETESQETEETTSPNTSNEESESTASENLTLTNEAINLFLQCNSIEPTHSDNGNESTEEYFDTVSFPEESEDQSQTTSDNKTAKEK